MYTDESRVYGARAAPWCYHHGNSVDCTDARNEWVAHRLRRMNVSESGWESLTYFPSCILPMQPMLQSLLTEVVTFGPS